MTGADGAPNAPEIPLGRPSHGRRGVLNDMRLLPGQVADLFVLAARRLWANRRLFIGLQIGVIVAATVAATVPLYSNGALQRLLGSELQPQNYRPAGAVMLRYVYQNGDQFTPPVQAKLQALADSLPKRAGIGTTPIEFYMASANEALVPDPSSKVAIDPSVTRTGFFEAETNFAAHVKIVSGRMFKNSLDPGQVVEAVISEATQQNEHMVVGQTYDLQEPGLGNQVPVKIVGIYQQINPTGPYWPYQFENTNLEISPQVFQDQFLYQSNLPLEEATWYTVLNLSQLAPSSALHLIHALQRFNTLAGQIMPHTALAVSPLSELQTYASRLASMESELLLISLPILALTLYYVAMMAGLAVQQERNEIAVLVSRGSRTWQILSLYAAEWLIMGAVAVLVAPFPAALLTEIVGSSTGFLVFVSRQPLAIIPTATMYNYETIAALLSLVAAMLPVFAATRESIVSYKQDQARLMRAPFWRRAYVDFILGFIAFYELHQFHKTNGAAAAAGANGALNFDPLLYLVPALFIAAAGLFLVRILPYIIRGLDMVLGRVAPLTLVLPARQLARTPTQFSPLIFLLVFTVALGLYSASTARTLDRNLSDSLAYQVGSDLQLYEVWAPQGTAVLGNTASGAGLLASGGASGTAAAGGATSGTGAAGGAASGTGASGTTATLQQFGGVSQATGLQPGQTSIPSALATGQEVAEPPFSPNQNLPGVVSAAQVFLEPATISVGGQAWPNPGQLMAINPQQFYATTWWRQDLSPFTLRAYMVALGKEANGVLASESFLQQASLQPGDTVTLSASGGVAQFVIIGAIQNWPGMYSKNGPMFVANFSYVQNTFGVVPYYVWFRTKANASYQTIAADLSKSDLFATQPLDYRVLLGQAHADPQRTGSLGLLTIGFLVAALLTVLGYLLYALLAFRMRLLQFGLLRAMGLARSNLSSAVLLEQVFLLLAGVAGGLFIGDWAAGLFLPFFQATAGVTQPPFIIAGPGPDLARMGAILAVLLGLAIMGLLQGLRGLRIGEAVKLGEE